MDIAVAEDKLSQAIGRGGQNIRLASQLSGWDLNVMTESDAEAKSESESKELVQNFMRQLDVGVLPVCADREVVGMITDRDIVTRAVADVLTPAFNSFNKGVRAYYFALAAAVWPGSWRTAHAWRRSDCAPSAHTPRARVPSR